MCSTGWRKPQREKGIRGRYGRDRHVWLMGLHVHAHTLGGPTGQQVGIEPPQAVQAREASDALAASSRWLRHNCATCWITPVSLRNRAGFQRKTGYLFVAVGNSLKLIPADQVADVVEGPPAAEFVGLHDDGVWGLRSVGLHDLGGCG